MEQDWPWLPWILSSCMVIQMPISLMLTWDELVKRDLKDWNIFKEIVLDRSAWRLTINVPD